MSLFYSTKIKEIIEPKKTPPKIRKKNHVVFAAIEQVLNLFDSFYANNTNFYSGASLSMFTEMKSMKM